MISFDEFKKVDLRAGEILEAQKVDGSDKLIKLQVDLGPEIGKRQIVAGIGLAYKAEDLIGRQIIVVANLEPKVLMGQESHGMLLAASQNGLPVLLSVNEKVPNGCLIK